MSKQAEDVFRQLEGKTQCAWCGRWYARYQDRYDRAKGTPINIWDDATYCSPECWRNATLIISNVPLDVKNPR